MIIVVKILWGIINDTEAFKVLFNCRNSLWLKWLLDLVQNLEVFSLFDFSSSLSLRLRGTLKNVFSTHWPRGPTGHDKNPLTLCTGSRSFHFHRVFFPSSGSWKAAKCFETELWEWSEESCDEVLTICAVSRDLETRYDHNDGKYSLTVFLWKYRSQYP